MHNQTGVTMNCKPTVLNNISWLFGKTPLVYFPQVNSIIRKSSDLQFPS